MYLLWLETIHKNFEEQEIYGHYNTGIFKFHRMNKIKNPNRKSEYLVMESQYN